MLQHDKKIYSAITKAIFDWHENVTRLLGRKWCVAYKLHYYQSTWWKYLDSWIYIMKILKENFNDKYIMLFEDIFIDIFDWKLHNIWRCLFWFLGIKLNDIERLQIFLDECIFIKCVVMANSIYNSYYNFLKYGLRWNFIVLKLKNK